MNHNFYGNVSICILKHISLRNQDIVNNQHPFQKIEDVIISHIIKRCIKNLMSFYMLDDSNISD